ncbi:MAG: hypothetical protein NVSMB70_01070 [Chamaesiphon sp.]
MAVTQALNQNNLGRKVSTRSLNWLQMVEHAWMEEFHAPDHGIYEFSGGRKFDSTDKTQHGIYNPKLGG